MKNRQLLNLLRANAERPAGIRSEVAGDTATVYVYGPIDEYWGVSAADFSREISAITAPNVVLRINSPGGDVFEARAMMAAIRGHSATFTANIDGLAASAATALTLACDRIEIADGAFYMIHQAWTFGLGNQDELRTTADLLGKVDGVLVDGYVGRTGKTSDEVVAWMKAETWFTAAEAVENGFADAVLETTAAASAEARAFNLSAYARAPKALIEEAPDDGIRQRMLSRLGLYERTAA
jgi:ATP-dependent protease ClpP protease subunit